MSTFIAYVNALTFTEALLVAFIFLCLFLMWWSHETAESDQGGIENTNPSA